MDEEEELNRQKNKNDNNKKKKLKDTLAFIATAKSPTVWERWNQMRAIKLPVWGCISLGVMDGIRMRGIKNILDLIQFDESHFDAFFKDNRRRKSNKLIEKNEELKKVRI